LPRPGNCAGGAYGAVARRSVIDHSMSGIVYASRNKYLVGDDRAMTAMRRQYRRGCAELEAASALAAGAAAAEAATAEATAAEAAIVARERQRDAATAEASLSL
jgi:hypothetical protein